jgi:PHD/YefM family antitoxin component YafN of YafNO toxin-antitoxin module
MKITKASIVSNSDVIKNYKTQRDKAEVLGKLFIFKNNQPDAVLISITEYERIAELLDLIEELDAVAIKSLTQTLHAQRRANPLVFDPESV